MLPSSWPRWTLILIAIALTIVTVVVGLVLEPVVEAITPAVELTPETAGLPPRLPYAASMSTNCVECHTSDVALREAGAADSALEHLLVDEDSPMTLHGRLGCATCHGGDGTADDAAAAHVGVVTNPSASDEAKTRCLPCHHSVRTAIPEHNIHTSHEWIISGIHEGEEVCACSNCHGPVAHGEAPIETHEFLGGYCIDCHTEQNVPAQRDRCSWCHVGPHDVAESLDCEICHVSTATWSKVELAVHPMELNNDHSELDCFDCHIEPDFRHVSGYGCSDCHVKPHEFGGEGCGQCHTDGGEWASIEPSGFDHLAIWEGYQHHENVACVGCHFQGYQLSSSCGSCHDLGEEADAEPSPAPEPTVEPDGDELTILSEHVTNRLDEWKPVLAAEALFENLTDGDETNDPLILSVRSREHYERGHIPGAYNIPWREIADPANLSRLPTDRQIVTYCYTGHTGQVAATILNILGYDAINLKFGMMGWTDDPEVLATEPFVLPAGYPVETEPNEFSESYEPPVWSTGETGALAIARARAEALLAEWRPTMDAEALFESLTDGNAANNPFVLSVRSAEDYARGHIAGAHNVDWRELGDVDNLVYLPTESEIVSYCYTGHTGQVAATVLGLLGYDVTNLKYGMMGWTDDGEVLATDPFVAPAGYPVEAETHELNWLWRVPGLRQRSLSLATVQS